MSTRLAVALTCLLALPISLFAVVPGTPQNLLVTVSGNTVNLAWSAPASGDAPTGYVINASLSPGGPIIAALPVSGTSLVLNGVPNGVYYVHVRAVNLDGPSGPSNEVVVSVPSGGSTCTAPPNAPTNLTATVAGSLVELAWSAPLGGCAPTAYSVHAGSAPGLSNLAILNVGAATTLSVSAPPGTYYVRVVALNAFGGSVGSAEVIVNVGTTPTELITINFDGLSGVPNRTPLTTTYTESGFTVTPTAQTWESLITFGNPAPFIQFSRTASQSTQVGEITVTSNGNPFRFISVDLYSSVTTIPHEIIGVRNGVPVFALSGTVPPTNGTFVTVASTQPTQLIDLLLIRVSNPATPCCNNPVGVDNIVLAR
jgi:hypothetical protein